jgi:hypothetical protein
MHWIWFSTHANAKFGADQTGFAKANIYGTNGKNNSKISNKPGKL